MEEIELLALGKQSVKSVFAVISQTFIVQMISTGSLLIVLTVLSPADVGIFVAVTAMRRVIDFFTDFGFGAALVQKKNDLKDGDLRTSFTIQSSSTFLIFLGTFLFRDQIAGFLKLNTQGETLLLALVFSVFLSSFKTIPSILLERKIQFQKLAIPQIAESLVYNIVLVILVLKGFRVDSYTYAFLAAGIIGIPFYYYVSPWNIGFGIDKKALKSLKFGLQFQAKNILAVIKDDLLIVLLTRFLSFTEIGYIGFAQRISFLPYRYIVDSVTKVTFSSYSRIQDNIQILRKAVEKSLFFVSSAMFPIVMGIVLTIPYFIQYIPKWHNKWEPAIFSIIFFCLNAAVASLTGILVNILDATGHVRKTLRLMIIWTIMTWILTPVLIFKFGYNGVAPMSFIVVSTIGYVVFLVKQTVSFDFIKSVYKPILCTLLMGVCVYMYSNFFVKDMLSLAGAIVFGAVMYGGSFYFLAKKDLHDGYRLIFKKT